MAGVPAGISAVLIDVIVSQATHAGYLTGYAAGTNRPLTSNVNFVAGQVAANRAVIPVGLGGQIKLANLSGGTIELAADISGYYAGGNSTVNGAFHAVSPFRLLDTRKAAGTVLGPIGPFATRPIQVAGLGGVPATAVAAVVMNLTITAPTSTGFVVVYPDGIATPRTSTINYTNAQTVANLAVIPLGSDGRIDLTNTSWGTTQVVGDVFGYVIAGPPSAGDMYGAIAPTRILDTRSGLGAPAGPLAANWGTVSVQVAGVGGIPATGVSAVVVNVTVPVPASPGSVDGYPGGGGDPYQRPTVSFPAGHTVAALAFIPVGTDGRIVLANHAPSATQLVADLAGYYLTNPAPPTPTVTGVNPNVGPDASGTPAFIFGTHLLTTTDVMFGYTAGTIVSVISDTQVSVIVPRPDRWPASFEYSVDVNATTRGGTSPKDPGLATYTYYEQMP